MRIPVLMLIFSFLLLIVTDIYIVWDLRKLSLYDKYSPRTKRPGKWWIVYSVFAVLILAVLVVAACLPRRSADREILTTMWLLYIVISVLFSQIVYVIFSLLGFIPKIVGARRWNTGLWVGMPLAVMIFTMMWWGATVGRHQIDVEQVEISSPRLPESFDGFKIAQISDLHVGTWGNDTSFISRLVDRVNALEPDVIVFTGDIVNQKSAELKPFIQVLGRLKAEYGVLSVLGNHDYGDYVSWKSSQAKVENLNTLREYEKSMGWQLLDNSHKVLKNNKGDSLILIGVGNWGEPPFSQYGNLKAAYPEENFHDSNFKVLLSHNPEHWNREVSKISNIDLTLAGHTHAMQIMFKVGDWKWSPSKYRYPQWAGLYNRTVSQDNSLSNLYVNIGAGEVGMPMRVGATPEITLITLRK